MQITEAILVGAPWKTDLQLWSTFYSITHPELENIYKVIDLINLAAWQFFFCHHLYEIPFPTTVVNKLLIEEENALHMPFFTGNVLKMCHTFCQTCRCCDYLWAGETWSLNVIIPCLYDSWKQSQGSGGLRCGN